MEDFNKKLLGWSKIDNLLNLLGKFINFNYFYQKWEQVNKFVIFNYNFREKSKNFNIFDQFW